MEDTTEHSTAVDSQICKLSQSQRGSSQAEVSSADGSPGAKPSTHSDIHIFKSGEQLIRISEIPPIIPSINK